MNLIQAINTYVWVWLETLKSLKRPAVLVPFLIFALVEVGLVASAAHFDAPAFGVFWIPLMERYPGPASLHYPNFFVSLPQLVSRLDLVLSAVLGCVTAGWGSLVLKETFLGQAQASGQSLKAAWNRYGALLLVAVVVAALTYLVSRVNLLVPPGMVAGYAKRLLALRLLYYALTLAVQAGAAYIPLAILFNGRGLGTAFREGFDFFWQHRSMSLTLVLLPFLLTLPISMLLENPARVALRFKPELLLTLSYANLAVAGLASFLMAGATVRFFLYRTRQDRVGAQS